MIRVIILLALLFVPTQGFSQDQSPHRTAFDGFLQSAVEQIPDCVPAPEEVKQNCATQVLKNKNRNWDNPEYAEIVIREPAVQEPVQIRVEGDDWNQMRTELQSCLDNWVSTGNNSCTPNNYKQKYLAVKQRYDAVLEALETLGTHIKTQ